MNYSGSIFIGYDHQQGDGLLPTHQIIFWEGGRPWFAAYEFAGGHRSRMVRTRIWLPTLEDMMDDLLLMAAVQTEISEDLLAKCKRDAPVLLSDRAGLYEVEESVRRSLYATRRGLDQMPSLAISLAPDSSLERHLSTLADYPAGLVVSRVAYCRKYSPWSEEWTTIGDLGSGS